MLPKAAWRRTATHRDVDEQCDGYGEDKDRFPANASKVTFDGSSRYVIHLTNSLAGSGLLACANAQMEARADKFNRAISRAAVTFRSGCCSASLALQALAQSDNHVSEHEQHEADDIDDNAHDCAESREHGTEYEPELKPVP